MLGFFDPLLARVLAFLFFFLWVSYISGFDWFQFSSCSGFHFIRCCLAVFFYYYYYFIGFFFSNVKHGGALFTGSSLFTRGPTNRHFFFLRKMNFRSGQWSFEKWISQKRKLDWNKCLETKNNNNKEELYGAIYGRPGLLLSGAQLGAPRPLCPSVRVHLVSLPRNYSFIVIRDVIILSYYHLNFNVVLAYFTIF